MRRVIETFHISNLGGESGGKEPLTCFPAEWGFSCRRLVTELRRNGPDQASGAPGQRPSEAAGDLVVLDPVIIETDHLLRARVGSEAARLFLRSLVEGEHRVTFLTPGLLRRAAELDERYADLDLGLVDAALYRAATRP
jgi:hypothetical protein